MAHTPGPWTYALAPHPGRAGQRGFEVRDDDGVLVASAHLRGSEPVAINHANAALLAAGPDLLAACKFVAVYSLPPTAAYDTLAEEFYNDTRIMAPGKSVALEMAMSQPPDDVRMDQWRKWRDERVKKADALLKAAIAKAEGR